MKQSLLMFTAFFVIDCCLTIIIANTTISWYIFWAVLFLEMAIYGSYIIYAVEKKFKKQIKKTNRRKIKNG